MSRFLHLADIHLGFDAYDNPERGRDFFWALQDALQRYAITPAVDFVVIAGDLFEYRHLNPPVLNQAQLCLQMLKQAQIPVIAIEGNHDSRAYGTKTSWLRYLAEWDGLILLEPGDVSKGEPLLSLWNADTKRGGYIDLPCGVRVIGSQWYGASATQAIAQLAEAIHCLPPPPAHTVMLFHHGLDGQISRYQGALSYEALLPLRQAGVNYLAMGHIHKNYEFENWIFNPGSLEANNVEEGSQKRGVYLVELSLEGIQATLKQEYYQRPIQRLRLTARGHESVEDLENQAIQAVQAIPAPEDGTAPIVELKIDGQVGFDRLNLDTRKLQQTLQELSGALVFLLRYNVTSVEYASPIPENASRFSIEQGVFTDLVAANNTYKPQASALAQSLIDLKDLQAEHHSIEHLYQFVERALQALEPTNLGLIGANNAETLQD